MGAGVVGTVVDAGAVVDAGTTVDAPVAPWNQLAYREYVMNESGYCVNLNGGVYHQAYGIASKQNVQKWICGDALVQ